MQHQTVLATWSTDSPPCLTFLSAQEDGIFFSSIRSESFPSRGACGVGLINFGLLRCSCSLSDGFRHRHATHFWLVGDHEESARELLKFCLFLKQVGMAPCCLWANHLHVLPGPLGICWDHVENQFLGPN